MQCRATQISQVLLNLLNNACDAIRDLPEKWIRIGYEESVAGFELSVTDSGTGIDRAILDKLFQPFFTTKGVNVGTGLGLSISKGIAESHGGSLEYDSSCPNTRFILSLPRQAGEEQAS